jgi:histidine kinase
LTPQATNELVADALKTPTETCEDMSRMIYDKTSGNVFFIVQLIKALYEEGVLISNNHGEWQWSAVKWNEFQDVHEIVDVAARRIKRLPEDCEHLMATAACIGAEFESKLISSLLLEDIPWTE